MFHPITSPTWDIRVSMLQVLISIPSTCVLLNIVGKAWVDISEDEVIGLPFSNLQLTALKGLRSRRDDYTDFRR